MTTKPSIALADLLEKGADTDLLREMIHHIVERVMQFDVENLCAAGYGERSPDRQNSRNGYRERLWETRAGSIAVKIPKLRSGSYFPPFLEPRRTAEKALAAVILEAYVQGVSTRSVDELVKAMGMSGISKSQVSRLCAEIDERVNAFLSRPLEGDWPYLWIDATYVKGREAGRIVSKAVIIVVAVNAEGVRELLGMAIGPSEAEPFWTDFLRSLTRRGLRGVKLVISRCARGPQGRRRQGARRHLAALQGALPPERARPRRQGPAADGARRDQHCVRAGVVRDGESAVARRVRSAARQVPEARRADGWRRDRRARLHDLPQGAPHADPQHQLAREAECGDKAAHRRRRYLPERSFDHAARRRAAARPERRVAATAPLHVA